MAGDDQDETLDVGAEPNPSRITGLSRSRTNYVPGDSIGPYVIRQRLGEGGFGVVFLCEQKEPVRREVAVKVIKRKKLNERAEVLLQREVKHHEKVRSYVSAAHRGHVCEARATAPPA